MSDYNAFNMGNVVEHLHNLDIQHSTVVYSLCVCEINIAIGVRLLLINTFFWYINNVPIYIHCTLGTWSHWYFAVVTCSLYCMLIHGAAFTESVFSCFEASVQCTSISQRTT